MVYVIAVPWVTAVLETRRVTVSCCDPPWFVPTTNLKRPKPSATFDGSQASAGWELNISLTATAQHADSLMVSSPTSLKENTVVVLPKWGMPRWQSTSEALQFIINLLGSGLGFSDWHPTRWPWVMGSIKNFDESSMWHVAWSWCQWTDKSELYI